MSFHEIRFPPRMSLGSIGGPERLTEVVTLANGFEERNTPWAHSRRRYDAGVGMRSLDDVGEMIAFFEARRGRLHGFRWKDWADFKSCRPSGEVAFRDQLIGKGDGSTTVFALSKTYRSGVETYVRPIVKPVEGSVRVGLEDDELQDTVHYEVDATTGRVIFATAPDLGVDVTAGFEFDVPVRFDTDSILTSVASFQAGEIPDVPVLEVRL
ncbi:DUF2460 domain-containing protein [Jannaschia sp. S6380]|uniref:DUF2460 domain-containing protein n=1 Tax=Jannaschia sp. S6380 TaxID=2926408 RepID=UPI001FF2A46A|nr:DUF2460 domain-containing protein [Jannaschia sp. S6380]MCK0166886.1 DUF2460 domain-containing protein [Jannaschia sp. S6380]